jgi:hypothetical protein
MRAQANFIESAPIVLVLSGLVELARPGSPFLLGVMGIYAGPRGHGVGMDGGKPRRLRMVGTFTTMLTLLGLASGPFPSRPTPEAHAGLTAQSGPPSGERSIPHRVGRALLAERAARAVAGVEQHVIAQRPEPPGDRGDQIVKLPNGKSQRPIPPWNSTSPTTAKREGWWKNTTWPGVCPGQWITSSTRLPTVTVSPCSSQRSA